MEPVNTLSIVTTGVGYLSTAVVVLAVILKGLPRFIELYTIAQDSIRKDLIDEVKGLKAELASERGACAEKIGALWERIEDMRQIVNHLVNTSAASLTPIGIALNRAYNTPEDMSELLARLNQPRIGDEFPDRTCEPIAIPAPEAS